MKRASDGVDHVIFVDVGSSEAGAENAAPDKKLKTPADSSSADPDPSRVPDTKIVVPGATLPPGPTDKSVGTITAVDATSITVTLNEASGQARTSVIDVAGTPFYAGETQCVPDSLTVGTAISLAYHFGEDGKVIGDAVMLMP
jgi:hypothetical protein